MQGTNWGRKALEVQLPYCYRQLILRYRAQGNDFRKNRDAMARCSLRRTEIVVCGWSYKMGRDRGPHSFGSAFARRSFLRLAAVVTAPNRFYVRHTVTQNSVNECSDRLAPTGHVDIDLC